MKAKLWMQWAVMILLMALMVDGVVEATVRWYLAEHSSIHKYLSEFRNHAEKSRLSLDEYGKTVGLDPYVGWGLKDARISQPVGQPVRTVLFMGDSVTAGHDVQAGVEDYPSLLADNHKLKVVNLAVRGYGIDQMWLKLMLTAASHPADLIVLAYIPHDLIRPGSDFNFGLPKPKFTFSDSRVSLNLAQNMDSFSDNYDSARTGFRQIWWFIGRYWTNRESYVPFLYQDYYEKLYRHIGDSLGKLSRDLGVPVAVVKLTNLHKFRGQEKLVELAASELKQSGIRFLDTDDCVLAKAKNQGLDLDREFEYHPTAIGHRVIADCLGTFLDPLLRH